MKAFNVCQTAAYTESHCHVSNLSMFAQLSKNMKSFNVRSIVKYEIFQCLPDCRLPLIPNLSTLAGVLVILNLWTLAGVLMLLFTNTTYIFLSHFFLQQGRPNAPSHTALPEPQALDRYISGKFPNWYNKRKWAKLLIEIKIVAWKNYDIFGAHNKFRFAYKSLA